MAIIHPFKAWHPSPDQVKDVSCPPYDVISTAEARDAAKDNPKSFLHVVRPEIDLPEGTAFNADSVYKKGAENLNALMDEGVLEQDANQALYIYQLEWKGRKQTGIFGCVSVDDYNNDIILKHELTRPAKEDDRTRHIVDQQAHAEPVMLTCKDDVGMGDFTHSFIQNNDALFDFVTPDNITHRVWKVIDTESLIDAFGQLNHLYIADGHHRCKAASRAAEQMQGNEKAQFFPAVIFPMAEMKILPYNRVVFNVPDDFKSTLKEQFEVQENADPTPAQKGTVCLYINGEWLKITLPESDNPSAVEQLDAYRMQHFILEPMLGIEDPRTNKNIDFVGGIRGTKELEKRVDSGEANLGISMYPTAIEELVHVSDQGLLMPPKSTWFEPKLRSGLLVHTFKTE
jgi:uncharacterized protein (DUF1015 family)